MLEHPLEILAVLLGVITLSLRLVKRYPWAAKLSTILWVIFISAIASNLGLIPKDAPLYGSLIDFAVPFAVCVILFTVSLSDVRDAGGPMLAAFVLAALGTAVGVAVASVLLEPLLANILEENAWKLAGPYTGTYIGGSLNFVALWSGLEIGNNDLFAAANAVDNLTLFPLYALWMFVPVLLADRYVVAKKWRADSVEHDDTGRDKAPLNPVDVATLFFLAVAVIALSNWLNAEVIALLVPGVPTILVVTTLALVLGQFRFVRGLQGAWEIGDLAFLVFFAAIGALIDFYQAVVLSPALFLYVMVIIVLHFAVLFGLGAVFKMDVGVLTIASVATKGGPPLVVPVAETKGWRHLVLPGIIIGMVGYAVGNYVGFGVAQFVRMVVG